MPSELVTADLGTIDPNPFRLLKTYPFNEHKIETLMRSIKDVGLWEGVIARRKGNRFQIAFGHHRLEAGKRSKLKTVSLIVRDLSDEQMLQFMGRENLEDYNANFLVMLETWEAAAKFHPGTPGNETKVIEIARLLGWTRSRGGNVTGNLNDTADACNAALALVTAGHLARDDLREMSVDAARLIVERTRSRVEMLDKLGKMGKRPAREIERDKKHIASAAKSVARDVREGHVTHKNIRSEIDYRAVKTATAKDRQSPLFASFVKEVAESIHKMLISDKAAEKLAEMEKALPHVTMEEDHAALRRIDFALAEHEHTTGKWRNRLKRRGQKVVPYLQLVKKGDVA